MHDTLFEHQEALEDDDLLLYAAEIGIDAARCARELAEGTHRSRVRADLVTGAKHVLPGPRRSSSTACGMLATLTPSRC